MKTVILAGGYGTRIRDVAEDIPKPMIPVGDHPILWHIMKGYAHYGVKDFVLCLGYKGDEIKKYFVNYNLYQSDLTLNLKTHAMQYHGNHNAEDWNITFAETGRDTMTAGRVKYIERYVKDDDYFLLTYGDGVGNIDIGKLIEFHKSHGKIMTVTGTHPPGRFGDLALEGNQVVGFNEKPQTHEGYISAGFFVCSRKIFDYLPDDPSVMLEREPMKEIVKNEQLMVYRHTDFWHPMDTSRDYNYLNDVWTKGQAPWKVWK